MKKIVTCTIAFLLVSFQLFAQNDIRSKDGITLTPVLDSPKFPKSSLTLKLPNSKKCLQEGDVSFQFQLKNYQLTDQTSDAVSKHCSNSAQGQHIHLILNNEPYLAKYETGFSVPLKNGNYVALAFLSRSYHESLKHKQAYQLTQFCIGNDTSAKVDLKAPMLFYSRPKGEYSGDDTKKVLLDFYLVNCKLSPEGYKVKATINNTEFILTDWNAYAMEGLPLGELIIKLELLDKNNKLVEGEYTSTTRVVALK